MDLGLKGKTALIACSSKGLGKASAIALAKEEANVIIFGRDKEALISLENEIKAISKARYLILKADILNEKEINSVFEKSVDAFKGIDILINNTPGPQSGAIEFYSEKELDKSFSLILKSIIKLTSFVLPYMKKNNWGRIINIASISSKQPLENMIYSNILRPAILGFAKTLSNEVAKYNILVNTVCPGVFDTDRSKQLYYSKKLNEKMSYEEYVSEKVKEVPLQRIGLPEELGNLIAFLSSEKASYITGNVIQIDGGLFKGLF